MLGAGSALVAPLYRATASWLATWRMTISYLAIAKSQPTGTSLWFAAVKLEWLRPAISLPLLFSCSSDDRRYSWQNQGLSIRSSRRCTARWTDPRASHRGPWKSHPLTRTPRLRHMLFHHRWSGKLQSWWLSRDGYFDSSIRCIRRCIKLRSKTLTWRAWWIRWSGWYSLSRLKCKLKTICRRPIAIHVWNE